MDRRNLIKIVIFLTIGFVCGFLSACLFKSNLDLDYGSRAQFSGSGFDALVDNEVRLELKKVSEKSVLVATPMVNAKRSADREQELVLTENSEVFAKTPKSDVEIYGEEAAKKIAELNALRVKAGRERSSDLYRELIMVKERAFDFQKARLTEISKQIDALPDSDRLGRDKLAAEMRAIAADYKLTPIKLSELQVGEIVSLFSSKSIDWSKSVAIERLVVERN